MPSYVKIPIGILLTIVTAYPLVDLIKSYGNIEHGITMLSFGLIITILVLSVILSILWLYVSLEEFFSELE